MENIRGPEKLEEAEGKIGMLEVIEKEDVGKEWKETKGKEDEGKDERGDIVEGKKGDGDGDGDEDEGGGRKGVDGRADEERAEKEE